MPRVTVEWLAIRSPEQRADIARKFTDAMVEVTGCQPDQVTVVFNEVDPRHQAKGGVFWTEILTSQENAK
jgi:4-oxalocrotonate tautomerase